MTDVVKRKPGRPRKVVVETIDGETPTTVVKPAPEPQENTNPITVEQTDSVTGEVIATWEDPGEEVELPEEYDEVYDPHSGEFKKHRKGALFPIDIASSELSARQKAILDRDYDGEPGGSRPRASLTDLQRKAFIQDAEDAYQQQVEVKRTDGFNRVWTFRHTIVDNRDAMQLRVDRGPTYAERLVSCAFYTVEIAEASIREIDEETAR